MGGESHDIDLEDEDDHPSEVEFLPPETRKVEKEEIHVSIQEGFLPSRAH